MGSNKPEQKHKSPQIAANRRKSPAGHAPVRGVQVSRDHRGALQRLRAGLLAREHGRQGRHLAAHGCAGRQQAGARGVRLLHALQGFQLALQRGQRPRPGRPALLAPVARRRARRLRHGALCETADDEGEEAGEQGLGGNAECMFITLCGHFNHLSAIAQINNLIHQAW